MQVNVKEKYNEKFTIRKVLMTAGIASYIDEANFHKEVMDDLKRHTSGDWGCLSEEDKLANDNALNNNERILSAYDTCHGSIWIITEWDRSVTTILFPSEY